MEDLGMGRNKGVTVDMEWLLVGTPALSGYEDEHHERMIKLGEAFTSIRHQLETSRSQGLSWPEAWRRLSKSDRAQLRGCETAWRDAFEGKEAPPEIAALSRCNLFG